LTKPETVQHEKLSYEKAKSNLVPGQTNKEHVQQWFGAPDMITKDAEGNPVWAYHNVSYQSAEESSHAVGVVGGAGGSVAGAGAGGVGRSDAASGSRTATLLIYFDQSGIVQEYKMDVQKY